MGIVLGARGPAEASYGLNRVGVTELLRSLSEFGLSSTEGFLFVK